MTTLDTLRTPCLLLDEARMTRNIARLNAHLAGLGVPLRPHLKTCKNLDVARRLAPSPDQGITVSTLKEAEYFADAGYRDILYAVGIAPTKLDDVARIRTRGVDLVIILDSLAQAQAVTGFAKTQGAPIPALIEIDTDGHRAGVKPEDPVLLEIARALQDSGALRGVMAHAGGSYDLRTPEELVAAAERERSETVKAATILRDGGFACLVVSVGSTPTAHFAQDLSGVTEVRAGVFVFFDLVMAGIGVCDLNDIAISVLTTVIGHRADGSLIVDAGWMAMSRDRGTASQPIDQGYGLVADAAGQPIDDLIMQGANQEHGLVGPRGGSGMTDTIPVGTLLRVYPNHACATAAQHEAYHVLDGQQAVMAQWPRFRGW
jgi:D-serine deaminase-like pyridoxal phosphate-dependent protein